MKHVCNFCKSPLTHVFCDLGHQPPSNSFLTEAQLDEPEVTYPLKAYVCEKCWLVQVPDYGFKPFTDEYPYFSSQSPSNVSHAKEYVDMMCERFGYKEGSLVLEIGSNDGYLLQHFKEKGIGILGFEPVGGCVDVAREKGIETIQDFFGKSTVREYRSDHAQADLICGINVLAHQPDIYDFVEGLRMALKPDGVITMEFPWLLKTVEGLQFDQIYQEHYSYFSLNVICKIFHKYGLAVFDIDEIPEHGGSLRIYADHEKGSHHISKKVPDLLSKESDAGLEDLNYYKEFQERIKKVRSDFMRFIYCLPFAPSFIIDPLRPPIGFSDIRPGKIWLHDSPDPPIIIFGQGSIAAYGAAAKAATFLNFFGIRNDLIPFIVDRSPHKQGLYLPGSHIPVVNEEHLRKLQPAYILITAWNLKEEIMKQLEYIREWGGKFVVAIPKLEIL